MSPQRRASVAPELGTGTEMVRHLTAPQGDGWYLASVSKKTSRGLLLHYIRTDEFEFVPKASLAEFARSEQLRFPQGASNSEGLSTDPNEMGADSLGHSAPPKPQRKRLEPPAEFACGDVEMCKNGKLPSMASNMPTIESLRTWKKECQLAFWQQRRKFWNGKKLSLLQQACRKHDVYPGGDGKGGSAVRPWHATVSKPSSQL